MPVWSGFVEGANILTSLGIGGTTEPEDFQYSFGTPRLDGCLTKATGDTRATVEQAIRNMTPQALTNWIAYIQGVIGRQYGSDTAGPKLSAQGVPSTITVNNIVDATIWTLVGGGDCKQGDFGEAAEKEWKRVKAVGANFSVGISGVPETRDSGGGACDSWPAILREVCLIGDDAVERLKSTAGGAVAGAEAGARTGSQAAQQAQAFAALTPVLLVGGALALFLFLRR